MIEQAVLQMTTTPEVIIQERKMDITCAPASALINAIGSKYGETPAWMGNVPADKTKYVLFVNPETKSWTMVHFIDNLETGCAIGVGNESINARKIPKEPKSNL